MRWNPRYYYILENHTSGKRYLGQTVQDISTYRGSGVYWKSHNNKNGGHNTTNIKVIWSKWFTSEKESQHFLDEFTSQHPNYWLEENTDWGNQIPETTEDRGFIHTSKIIQDNLVKQGKHHLQRGDIQSKENKRRVESGTHNFQDPEQRQRLIETHKRRASEGKHNLQDLEMKRRVNKERVDSGTHNFLGVTCRNKEGKVVSISKEVYYSQEGDMSTWEYVSVVSKEGKKRKL